MAIIIGLWVVFCLGIFMVESFYSFWLGKSVERHTKVLQELNVKKEQTMALIEAGSRPSAKPDVRGLSEIFDHFPLWSKVMESLAKSMPSGLNLTSISTEYVQENPAARKIELSGMARNTSSLAGLIKALNDNPLFSNMVISKSERINGDPKKIGYSFVILGEVIFRDKKWN